MTKIHLGHNILDHQLLDKDGRRCGNVDDLAVEEAEVVAIFSGPGVWPQRSGWIGRLAGWIGGSNRVRIPWDEVTKVDSAVHLRRTAPEYGLGKGDGRVRPLLERIPGANR
jgi:sporulation protein YlmC with PRC-barrel domain